VTFWREPVPFSSRGYLTIGGGSMARPKEFNQDQAIRQAIALFSQQGFAATSTDDLKRVMGISRQSMYDTFGDKRALFLRALELYVTDSVRRLQFELEKPGSPLSAVTNALVTFAERKDMASANGCMGLNAISEFGERDDDVTRISRIAARSQRDTLVRVLEKAKERGEMDPETDIDNAVDFLECTFAGIRMAAKAGKSRRSLRQVAVFAGKALRRRNT